MQYDEIDPKELSRQLAQGLNATSELIQELVRNIHKNEVSIVAMERDMKYVLESVMRLSRLLVDGNGKKSVIDRVDELEGSMENLQRKLDQSHQLTVAGVTGRWQFWAQTIATIGALVIALVALFGEA